VYNKGDLVTMIYHDSENNSSERLIGLVLDVASWPEYKGDGVTDLYVHWSNGRKFWCCDEAITLLSNYLI